MHALHRLVAQSDPDGETSEVVETVLPSGGVTAEQWIQAAVILGVAIVLSRLIKAVIIRRLRQSELDLSLVILAARVLADLVIVLGVFYALTTLGVQLTPLIGALGIGGLAIAFAAQTILANTFASVVIRTSKPFVRGDQIETNDQRGTVVDINFRVVVLRNYDGEMVLIPASNALDATLVNQTRNGIRRTSLPVGVAYDTPLPLAQEVLLDAVGSVDGVRPVPQPEVLVTAFGDSSIDFVVRYWHDPDEATFWRMQSAVAMQVKAALDGAGITIPFPQRTLGWLDENTEGSG